MRLIWIMDLVVVGALVFDFLSLFYGMAHERIAPALAASHDDRWQVGHQVASAQFLFHMAHAARFR
jgi:hypothetical protein